MPQDEIPICECCESAPSVIQAMYPEFDTENPNILFWMCEKCSKSPYMVIPTNEEKLLIEMGIEITNPKIEKILQEVDEIIGGFLNNLEEQGIHLERLNEDSPD